ncbi:MAG TPA: DNA polymerase I [Chloroflexota bacterium]
MAGLILFYDGHALVHRAYHAVKPLTTSKGELTNAVFGFATMLLKSLSDFKPQYGAVAFDRHAPTFRHNEYADYKANRVRMADDLRPQFDRVRELVEALGIPIFEIDGFEADDVLGTLARQAVEKDVDVVIVTGDTDALQLVGPRVRVLTPSRGMSETVLYDEKTVAERYGLEPRQIIDYKALKGDPSDNIKGVPGVGEKTAQRLLAKYGTIEQLLELPDDLDPKLRDAIGAHADTLRLGKRLTRILDDVPIELRLEGSRIGEYDRARANGLLRDLEFRSLIDRLPAPSLPPKRNGPVVEQISMFDDRPAEEAAEKPPAAPIEPLGQYRLATTEAELAELTGELAAAEVIAFDTETDQLGPLTAPIAGISFSTRGGTGWYVPLGHRGEGVVQLPIELVVERLRPILADPARRFVGHHAKYDLEVLHRYGIEVANVAFDTMIAAFVLDTALRSLGLKDLAWTQLGLEMTPILELIGKGKKQIAFGDVPVEAAASYAAADADVTLRLHDRFGPQLDKNGLRRLFDEVEMPGVPVLTRMEEVGVAIDAAYLRRMSGEMAEQLAGVETEIWELAGHQFNVNSPIQLGKVLFDELKLPRGRRTRTGYSTDADVLEELRGVHPIVDKLFEFRQIAKLKSTYVDALPAMVNRDTGRVHTSFNQVGASTGRLSSSEPNLQNIPIRSDLGRDVRRAFVAGKPGTVLLAADYSQVELRILAHITRDEALLQAFSEGQDVHRVTASRIFGVPLDQVNPDQRRLAKVVNYGIAYGLGDYGLSVQAGIGRQEAGQFIRSYLERHSGIARYIQDVKLEAAKKGYVETLLGRRIQIPEIASPNRGIRAAAERRAINAPIQGSNADFMKLAMSRVDQAMRERGLKSRMILQVHDELVFEALEGEIEPLGAIAREKMAGAYELDPPLEVEIKVGQNWCDVE